MREPAIPAPFVEGHPMDEDLPRRRKKKRAESEKESMLETYAKGREAMDSFDLGRLSLVGWLLGFSSLIPLAIAILIAVTIAMSLGLKAPVGPRPAGKGLMALAAIGGLFLSICWFTAGKRWLESRGYSIVRGEKKRKRKKRLREEEAEAPEPF
jgi:hypothetical protein